MSESFQNGAIFDGLGIVLWVPTIADPSAPTVAELTAGTAQRITYGLAADGFALTPSSSNVAIDRYSSKQMFNREGAKTYALVIKYAYNRQTPTGVETVLGTPGTEGFFVQLLGYPNSHTIAVGTKVNAVVPVQLVASDDVPPTRNTELFKQMTPDITGEVRTEVSVVTA